LGIENQFLLLPITGLALEIGLRKLPIALLGHAFSLREGAITRRAHGL